MTLKHVELQRDLQLIQCKVFEQDLWHIVMPPLPVVSCSLQNTSNLFELQEA